MIVEQQPGKGAMQRRKLIISIIFLGLVAALCGTTTRVPAQQSAPTTSDQTFESALAQAGAECKTLGSNPIFDRLRDKVPSFFGQQPTPLTFTNKDRLHRKDRAVLDLVVGANQQCRTAYAPLHAMLPPQAIAAIHDLQRKEDALIRKLYVGRITFGEFNMKLDGLNKEYSALVVRSRNVIERKQTSQTNTNSEIDRATKAFLDQISRPKTAQAQQEENAVEPFKKATELQAAGQYGDAILYMRQVLEIEESRSGPNHVNVGQLLSHLANLYRLLGRYADAEPLLQRSLAIQEKALGHDHPHVAISLNDLALLYFNQGRYVDAELLFRRSLAINEKSFGSDHPEIAIVLGNLALLYANQGRYVDAEPLYRRSLAIKEKALGPDHPHVAQSLNNLALLYFNQGRYVDAELLFRRSLAINEKSFGSDHPEIAIVLGNLASLYANQGRYVDAEPLHRRALAIREKALGPDHPMSRHRSTIWLSYIATKVAMLMLSHYIGAL